MKSQPQLTLPTTLLLVFSLLATVAAQTPAPAQQTPATQTPAASGSPQPSPTPQDAAPDAADDVVRITSNLVQVDVVVTDKQGRLVTDLTPEDFEVLVDGKQQPITNFSFVSNESRTVTTQPVGPAAATPGAAAPVPPARLRPEQVRRTIALVADDLGTSFESIAYVRTALRKFVDEQMQPGDLVAVMRTSAGMGALQQFTSDKRVLYAAIERIRWFPSGRAGISAFNPIAADPMAEIRAVSPSEGSRDESGAGNQDEFREEIFSVGTLGALNFIVRGLRELPGRKSVVMFSDGFEIFNQNAQSGGRQRNERLLEALRRLVDLANRAAVVIYTIDARGLPYTGLTAEDSTGDMSQSDILQSVSERGAKLFNTQEGLNYLAQQTGGLFIRNTNDLARGVRRVLEDQRGYYLIGYRPDESVFRQTGGRARFNEFRVKLKRPGLSVRTRSGFYNFTDENARTQRRTRTDQLVGALTSPFSSSDVRLRLTSLFSSASEKSNIVSSLMYIDVSNFKFTEEADGWRKAVLDVYALVFGENGEVVDEINRTETVKARGETFDRMMRNGLIYTMRIPVKKAGAYQLRVAVRDTGTEKIGAASQFIEVPNLKNDRLALSGILLEGGDANSAQGGADGAGQAAGAEGLQKEPDPMSSAAVRRFRQNSEADYFFHIYNAKLDAKTRRPQLLAQMRLFRDGKLVYAGTPTPFDPGDQPDMKRLQLGRRIQLGSNLAPGEYILQVVITDMLAKEKQRTATQWTEFEIVK